MKKLYIVLVTLIFSVSIQAQTVQTVVVEHFTNSVCSVCAAKNPAFYNLLDDYPQVLHVAYHPSAPYSSCIFHQHNPAENDARTNYYGVYGATPRVVVQGEVISPASQLLTAGQLENALDMMSDYSVSFKHYYGNGDTVHATITVRKVSGMAQSGINLYAVLAEKLIGYNAPNGEDMHHDVFRKVVVDETINLTSPGDSITYTASYTTHPDWNQEEIYVVAMVQQESDKSILQAGKSGFADNTTGVAPAELETPENVFYPNPAVDHLYIKPEYAGQFISTEIFNLFGEKVKSTQNPGRIEVNDLPDGYYFLVMKGKNNTRYTTKFVKK